MADESQHIVKEFTLPKNQERSKQFLFMIREEILGNKKLRIMYQSLKPEKLERMIHHYINYQHHGDLYVFGFCEIREDDRDLKLGRIERKDVLLEVCVMQKKSLKGL